MPITFEGKVYADPADMLARGGWDTIRRYLEVCRLMDLRNTIARVKAREGAAR